jgi:cytochrome c
MLRSNQMPSQIRHKALFSTFAATLVIGFSSNVLAVDAEAAKITARQNGCFKCHSVDKEKEGPTYTKVAAKYRTNGKSAAENEQRLITHITSGEKAKFPDGHEEEHKIIKTKDPEQIKNLIGWILSL